MVEIWPEEVVHRDHDNDDSKIAPGLMMKRKAPSSKTGEQVLQGRSGMASDWVFPPRD